MIRRLGIRATCLAVVALLVPACGGGSSSGGGGGGGGVIVIPNGNGTLDDGTSPWIVPGGTPNLKLIARGGNGSTGPGGAGGGFEVNNAAGSNTRVLKTGTVNADFFFPVGTPNLGSNVKTVSGNETITPTTLGAISTFFGDDNATAATGLHVLAGGVATFAPNVDSAVPAGNDYVQVSVTRGIWIEGTVRCDFRDGGTTSRSHLYFAGEDLLVGPTGVVNNSGVSVAPGGNGGNAGEIWFNITGAIILRGTILTTGGDGDAGGLGGGVSLHSLNYGVYNTGPITTTGGAGNDGIGGGGGRIHFYPSQGAGSFTGGGAYNRGNLTARGGNGTLGGGQGDWVILSTWPFSANMDGNVVNSGNIDNSGGDALVSGNGGNGGNPSFAGGYFGIYLTSIGGNVRVTGDLKCKGGKGAGGGNGGNGRNIEISSNGSGSTEQFVPCGNYIGASMDTSGGDGAIGGNAGALIFWDNANFGGAGVIPGQSPFWMVGVTSADLSGGDGATNGGNAGYMLVRRWTAADPGGNLWYGSAVQEVDVTGRGGNGASGNGGGGAYIEMQTINGTSSQESSGDNARVLLNKGTFDLTGGNGSQAGGWGGFFYMRDVFHTENHGAVTSVGGSGGTAPAGGGNGIQIRSDGTTVNVADLTSLGGDSSLDRGGNGGQVFVEGKSTRHSGDITSRGGNGVTNAGGNGGSIEIGSWGGGGTTLSGTLGVQPGTGTPNGFFGIVTIDGIRVALVNGSITY